MIKFKSHYERTGKARDTVINYLKLNRAVEHIDLYVVLMNTTGLGNRWLNEYLELLTNQEQIKIDGSMIFWIDKKKGGKENV